MQSIIEEEGGALPLNTDSNDHKNWDQPLIIAEPDVQVRIMMSLPSLPDSESFISFAPSVTVLYVFLDNFAQYALTALNIILEQITNIILILPAGYHHNGKRPVPFARLRWTV
jgi:hypothetical protein